MKSGLSPKPSFPSTRMRRNRSHQWTRNLVAENSLSVHDLILPLFVHSGHEPKIEIPSLPGINRLSLEQLVSEVCEAKDLGIPLVAIFPVIDPSLKTEEAEEAYNSDNLIGKQIIAVCNFPTKNIAGIVSEVLILGAVDKYGKVVLLHPSQIVDDGLEVY